MMSEEFIDQAILALLGNATYLEQLQGVLTITDNERLASHLADLKRCLGNVLTPVIYDPRDFKTNPPLPDEIWDAVHDEMKSLTTCLSAEQECKIYDILLAYYNTNDEESGIKIQAIKDIRSLTGYALKEAKTLVELVRKD